jgi:hypothetical protein
MIATRPTEEQVEQIAKDLAPTSFVFASISAWTGPNIRQSISA